MTTPIGDRLRLQLASHCNETLAAHSHEHACGPFCANPCQHAGKVYVYGPFSVPQDHIMLEWYTLADGGRVVNDMHVDALAAHLSGLDPLQAITHASASAALAQQEATTGNTTGVQKYLDRWRDEGLI